MSDKIIETLATSEPSRESNVLVALALGWCHVLLDEYPDNDFTPKDLKDAAGAWYQPGDRHKTWEDPEDQERWPTELPDWTGSLDAKVPGENIVYVQFTAEEGWVALHGTERANLVLGDGLIRGHHPTSEATARRIAGLKGREEANG